MTDSVILQCSHLAKRFSDGDLETDVLSDINLTVNKGDRIAIIGSSGSGKSTLLHLLGGLDQPSSGTVEIHGNDINALSVNALSKLRNQSLGFVYQFHHLLPEFTAVENVAIPLVIGGEKPQYAQQQAEELLIKVGLGHRLIHKPSELSGGERQRVAIGRALMNHPKLLLVDEPTGNLDSETGNAILDVFEELIRAGQTIVMVTHDEHIANRAGRIITLTDGKIEDV